MGIAFQALVYPMIDDRAGTSRELAGHIGYFGWSPDANRFGWQSFLGCKPGGRNVPRAAVPARVRWSTTARSGPPRAAWW